jgi:hypothetical protein
MSRQKQATLFVVTFCEGLPLMLSKVVTVSERFRKPIVCNNIVTM